MEDVVGPELQEKNEDVHGNEVCETLVHYLPWMLIASMGATIVCSFAVVLLGMSMNRKKKAHATF